MDLEKLLENFDKDEKSKDYSSNTYTGNPDISQIFVKLNANGYIGGNTTGANLHVVFNAPIHHKASGNLCTIVVANNTPIANDFQSSSFISELSYVSYVT